MDEDLNIFLFSFLFLQIFFISNRKGALVCNIAPSLPLLDASKTKVFLPFLSSHPFPSFLISFLIPLFLFSSFFTELAIRFSKDPPLMISMLLNLERLSKGVKGFPPSCAEAAKYVSQFLFIIIILNFSCFCFLISPFLGNVLKSLVSTDLNPNKPHLPLPSLLFLIDYPMNQFLKKQNNF